MGDHFFSIVIPTRNRPELFLQSLESVLRQDFKDYEIIVSDNSSDFRTRDAFSSVGDLKNVAYYRPESELCMPDHWEFATLKATGKYVLILTDRSVLFCGALNSIYASIVGSKRKVQLCSWAWGVYDDSSGVMTSPPTAGTISFKNSDSILANFIAPQYDYPYMLPRGLNSCYSAELSEKIRGEYGRVFFPINPDYHSSFLFLHFVDDILYFDFPIFVSHGLGVSNGGSGYLTDASAYLNSLGKKDWYAHVPLKMALIENIIYEDYLDVSQMVSDGRSWDWIEYFVRTYKELLDKKSAGLIETDKLEQFFLNWRHALNSQIEGVQLEVTNKVARLERRHRLKRSLPSRIYSWLLRKSIRINSPRKFAGVMEAAGYINTPLV